MTQLNRLFGGLIDRASPLSFTFDGQSYQGFAGDTLASALLANGVRLMGRSFKYHRPRGVLSAGSEEPNALVALRDGARREPNTRATVAELFDGLTAESQNRWPSLSCDVQAVNDLLSPFLAAGFYYKTFMWPRAFWEKLYEPAIRRAAGLGSLSTEPDLDVYDKGFLHCDLLVIGAGPAGLMAALTAARSGAQVILADEDFRMGGRLTMEAEEVAGQSGSDWAIAAVGGLASMANVRLMSRTTVLGAFDHGIYSALERNSDHLAATEIPAQMPRQTLWRIYARASLLCAGATERMIGFANNDRPGVMLAGAMRAYANRWAVTPGQRVTVFTATDDGHRTARDLSALGVEVIGVIDSRPSAKAIADYPLYAGSQVIGTTGRLGLKTLTLRDADGRTTTLASDALAVSGGWSPNVALTSHQPTRPLWQPEIAAFVPGPNLPQGMRVAGAAAGKFSTHAALLTGQEGAIAALSDLGINAKPAPLPRAEDRPYAIAPLWYVAKGKGRKWIDFQNDVTVKDVQLAHQEGFRAVEHLKRYTTLGMATDQGKTANVTGLAVMAEMTGASIKDTGTTMFRPPYTPVSLGALAGRATGKDFKPTRRTPSHDWACEQGAVFVEAGLWLRAQYFPRPGETHWRQTVDREARAVRACVGVCDVSTLGKIDVQGEDAAEFLNFVYANGFAKLPVGKCRYGIMLREDGIVMDDGTAARLGEDHFVVTTTTGNAGPVYRHMEFVHQCLCPEMDVQMISITDAWAQYSVAGPNARKLLQKLADPGVDLSNEALPFMGCTEITICGGRRARLFRISFSGELAYEIAVPTRYGDALMRRVMEQGAEFDVTPYGTEALGVLRIEKGHATANELNGQTSADHLGMGRMVSTKKDAIGAVLSRRAGLNAPDGLRLMGFESLDQTDLPAGSHLYASDAEQRGASEGWITSAAYSPHLEKPIALGFLTRGQAREGEIVILTNPLQGQTLRARVVSPHFIDPKGDRLRG